MYLLYETAEKEVQDTSCRGSGSVPQLKQSPKIGGYRGLIDSISAFSYGELEIGSPLEWITAFSNLIPNGF